MPVKPPTAGFIDPAVPEEEQHYSRSALWLVGALALQVLTYMAQGQVFRVVLRAGAQPLSLWEAGKLSVMKLFVDQALPSSGISGAFAVVASFVRLGFAKPLVLASLVLDLSGYFL